MKTNFDYIEDLSTEVDEETYGICSHCGKRAVPLPRLTVNEVRYRCTGCSRIFVLLCDDEGVIIGARTILDGEVIYEEAFR